MSYLRVTRKPWQPRRVAMQFTSKMKGRKKTLCQWRYRGSVKMTMRVRRPLQGSLRKEIRSYGPQLKKVKKTRRPNCFFLYWNMRQSQRRRQNQKRR
ncbi:hypothetical protein FD754_022358 [Muntiacus muntjak]|uniref:Uncharacterized protein n=1 Tax=Muntiacus muntjak TaxID=9888 RepID=A0A5N3V825_MUNMU|nr:hypothetical protein FD754_022358 [Muntiacus muntjak]